MNVLTFVTIDVLLHVSELANTTERNFTSESGV